MKKHNFKLILLSVCDVLFKCSACNCAACGNVNTCDFVASTESKLLDRSKTCGQVYCVELVAVLADGTEIEGTVINSILFRGAKVGKNTVVENSIIMQDTIIGDNVKLNCVVTDKNVTIKDRNNLSGCEQLPYYVSKNVMI